MPYADIKYKLKKCGKNVVIGQNVYIRYPEEFEIGDNVIIDEFCYFTTKVKLGSYIHIAPSCTIIGGPKSAFEMGDFSAMAAGCRIVCTSDDFLGTGHTNPTIPEQYRSVLHFSTVRIGDYAVLGTGCVVHTGVRVGEGAAVGSMSLLTKDIEPWGVYMGIPAKRIKDRPSEWMLRSGRLLLSLLAEERKLV